MLVAGGNEACAGAEDVVGECSPPVPTRAGYVEQGTDPADQTEHVYTDVGGRDEVHGESSDDTVYTGCGADTIFGTDGAVT